MRFHLAFSSTLLAYETLRGTLCTVVAHTYWNVETHDKYNNKYPNDLEFLSEYTGSTETCIFRFFNIYIYLFLETLVRSEVPARRRTLEPVLPTVVATLELSPSDGLCCF